LEQYRQDSRSIDRFACENAALRVHDNAMLPSRVPSRPRPSDVGRRANGAS
jgi:hypothetical protein